MVLRNFTTEAAPLITEQLDFVFIDARHDYCGVLQDLQLYYPKVGSGGRLGEAAEQWWCAALPCCLLMHSHAAARVWHARALRSSC